MNWKKEAADKLRNYTARQQAVNNITAELHRLACKAVSIRSATADGSPVQGGGSGREDAILNNLCRRQELERQLEQVQLWCSVVDGALAVLTEQERLVLDRFYIHPSKGNLDRYVKICVWRKARCTPDEIARSIGSLQHYTDSPNHKKSGKKPEDFLKKACYTDTVRSWTC